MTSLIRRVCALVTLLLAATALTVPAATAAPIRLGPVKNLDITATAGSGGFTVTSSWDALTGATSYKLSLTANGTTVATAQIADTSWTQTVARPAGTQVKVTVTPMKDKRKGTAASDSVVLPDVTGPSGAYDVSWDGFDATVTQTALFDDVTAPASIQRTINWGEPGGVFESYPAGSVAEHSYAALGRYVPRVKLVDQAGNTTTLTLHAVVIGDTKAPTGSFSAGPQSGWAKVTSVSLSQASLSDNFTPAALVERSVDWGDGSAAEKWTTGTTISHVYQAAGTYQPSVVLTDEAGNVATVSVSQSIVISPDNVAPKGTFTAGPTTAFAGATSVAVTQTSLSDNVSAAAKINRSVVWGDGSPAQAWPATGQPTHVYTTAGTYQPQVIITDEAGNAATVNTPKITVVTDKTAPAGAFTAGPQEAWTAWTPVALKQVSLSDDYTAASAITRTVDWGDGTDPEAWPKGTPLSHVYAEAGTYQPRVVIKDLAGNEAVVKTSSTVVVTTDTVRPRVKLTLPTAKLKKIKTWKTLKGTAIDRQTGVATVQVKIVQKRTKGWFALKGKRWVKAATKKQAFAKAKPKTKVPTETGEWKVRVPRLRKGKLAYKVRAFDNVGNKSTWAKHAQRITKR